MFTALFKFKIYSAKLKFSLISLFFLLFTFNFLLISPVSAQQALGPDNFNYLINGQTTIEGSIFHSFFCMIMGLSPLNPCAGFQITNGIGTPKLGADNGALTYAKPVITNGTSGGAMGAAGSLMAGLYKNPPTSTTYYLADLGNNFGLIKPTYAQNVTGSGEGIVHPVLKLWQITRNLAYLAFILVIIAIGFMIMFRQRINPQTVVTIQQAIPSIVIGLALVTFSYLIASLIIDLTFISVQLVTQVFIEAKGNIFGGAKELNGIAQNGSIFNLFGATLNAHAFGQVFGGTFDEVTTAFGFGSSIIPGVLGAVGGFLAFGIPGAIIAGGAGLAAPLIIPSLIILILIFALFIQMIRLVFALISAYIEILVFTVVGPFLILFGSIPGRGGTISFWFRALIANAMIFPAVLAAFFFAGVILGSSGSGATASLFTAYAQANVDNHVTLPLFGGLSSDFIKVLIAYGILLGMPAIPGMVKEAFKYKGPQGIPQEALAGVNYGLAGYNSTRAMGGGLVRRGYEGGRLNSVLEFARARTPGFLERRIYPANFPTGSGDRPPRSR